MAIKIGKFKNYFFNLILIWIVILLYRILPYYANFLKQDTQTTIFYLALGYTILGFIYYLFVPENKIRETKGTIIFNSITRLIKEFYYYIKYFKRVKSPFPKLEKKEKTAILFVIVKIFFLPIMLNFFFANFFSFKNQINNLDNLISLLNINSFNFAWHCVRIGYSN